MTEGIHNQPHHQIQYTQQTAAEEQVLHKAPLSDLIQDHIGPSQQVKESVVVGEASRPVLPKPDKNASTQQPTEVQLPEYTPRPRDPKIVQQQIQQFPNSKLAKLYEEDFTTAIEELLADLPEEELNKFPGSTKNEKQENLRRALKEKYEGKIPKDVEESAVNGIYDSAIARTNRKTSKERREQYTLAASNDSSYTNSVDKELAALSDQQLAAVPGTDRQQKLAYLKEQLLYKYYTGESKFPANSADMNVLLEQIFATASDKLNPAAELKNVDMYQSRLNGLLLGELESIMRNKGLSTEESQYVFKALCKPLDPNDPISAKAYSLKNQALGNIQKNRGIPLNWAPSAITASQVQNLTTIGNSDLGAFRGLEEMIDTTRATIEANVPKKDPMREKYLDFLKIMSAALQDAKEFLYELQAKDSEMGKMLSAIRMEAIKSRADAQMKNIEKQRKQREEIRRKQKKKKNSPINKVMNVVSYVGMGTGALMAIAGGPLGIAMFIAMMFLTKEGPFAGEIKIGGKPLTIESGMDAAIDSVLDDIPGLSLKDRQGLKFGLKLMTIAAFMQAGGVMALNPDLAFQLFMNSGSVEDAATVRYADRYKVDKQGNKLSNEEREKRIEEDPDLQRDVGITKVTLTMAYAAAQVACGFCAARGMLNSANAAAQMSKSMARLEQVGTIMLSISSFMQSTAATVSSVKGYQEANIQADILKMRAALARLEGKDKSEVEEIKQFIDLMQKLLNKLMSSMKGVPEQASQINDLLSDMYSNLSQSQSALFQSQA